VTNLRVLHTSDWHLGHTLHDVPREYEHRTFLSWLLDTLEEKKIDSLLISGDIFDSANPGASAQKQWYRFLANAVKRLNHLDIVVIGGNHDSAARLDAPDPILSEFGIHVIGGATPSGTRRKSCEYCVSLTNRNGETAACVAAVPFLRPADLPRLINPSETEDDLIERTRHFYRDVLEECAEKTSNGMALIAMGHLYMTGTTLSELSERKILGGNQHALPHTVFPDYISYTALGHLHLGQKVGRDNIRYSGSPIPLSLSERKYTHHVVMTEFNKSECRKIEKIRIPRCVDMIRVPDAGFIPLIDLKQRLRQLDLPARDEGVPPLFLEVGVLLEKPEPTLRAEIAEEVNPDVIFLAKISVEYTGNHREKKELFNNKGLSELDAEDVFIKRWEKDYSDPPGTDILNAFSELYEKAWEKR